jgi:hypothetical protein
LPFSESGGMAIFYGNMVWQNGGKLFSFALLYSRTEFFMITIFYFTKSYQDTNENKFLDSVN